MAFYDERCPTPRVRDGAHVLPLSTSGDGSSQSVIAEFRPDRDFQSSESSVAKTRTGKPAGIALRLYKPLPESSENRSSVALSG